MEIKIRERERPSLHMLNINGCTFGRYCSKGIRLISFGRSELCGRFMSTIFFGCRNTATCMRWLWDGFSAVSVGTVNRMRTEWCNTLGSSGHKTAEPSSSESPKLCELYWRRGALHFCTHSHWHPFVFVDVFFGKHVPFITHMSNQITFETRACSPSAGRKSNIFVIFGLWSGKPAKMKIAL